MKTSVFFRLAAFVISLLVLYPAKIQSQFVPGEGGVISFTPFTPEEGKFGGLLVSRSDRYWDSFFGGARIWVQLEFPDAAALGVQSLTLQFKNQQGNWENYIVNDAALTTTGNNFVISPFMAMTLRLKAAGGAKNDYTSNEVEVIPSNKNTRFSSWGLDESMWISGVMVPWVGRGLQASINVKNIPDETDVSGGLNYQWYRVNPLTYAITPINGATALTYTTTDADVGYFMKIKATGDGQAVGGYVNMVSNWPVVHPNKAFASNITLNGFRLNLFKNIHDLPANELEIRDKNFEIVPIISVTKVGNDAMYDIQASFTLENSPYSLYNNSPFWKLAHAFNYPGHEMMMEFISIDVSTVGLDIPESNIRIFPVPAKDLLNFSADDYIHTAEIINLQGKTIIFANINGNTGYIDISNLEQGSYLIRLTGKSNIVVKSFTKF